MSGTAFRHGVASGDPTSTSVIIWTRVTPRVDEAVEVVWKMRADDGSDAGSGTAVARPERDWTVSVDVGGLLPGAWYVYWFETDDARSRDGRTRTLPRDDAAHFRFAAVSCAKYNAGFFNAFGRIADRADRDEIDFFLHLGDYIYEEPQSLPKSTTPVLDVDKGRAYDPPHECVTLSDYRRRYAQYRTDPDLQRVHAAAPMIASVDDHEFANGAWLGGAEEHVDERDGPWSERLAAAFQARAEWLPVRHPDPHDPQRVFRTVRLGALADLILVDTRTRRDQPVPAPEMDDLDRSALGHAQREWLFGELRSATAPWTLMANPSVMARTWADDLPDPVKAALQKLKMIDPRGTGPDYDQWEGYPAERAILLRELAAATQANRTTVVLSGDIHVALAADLTDDGGAPAAAEFVTSSITSQNLDEKMGWEARTHSLAVEAALLSAMPEIRFCDLDSHGYSIVDVTPERLEFEWWAVDSVQERSSTEHRSGAFRVLAGDPRLRPIADDDRDA